VPKPIDVHILKSFIGLCNYYRIYVQDFSTIVHPLYALVKKDVTWTWSEEAQEAFNTLKEKLSELPIMRRPNFNKVFILHTDNKAKSNYFSYEGECLAVVWAIIHFKPYLYGIEFTLYTDHQPIKWLMTNDKLTSKLTCWAIILQEYEFKVIHRPSITH
jgi:hypothetical protein